MYRITSNNITRYSDSITHICLNTNGSYNLCFPENAEGFVARVPTVCTDDSGNAYTAIEETTNGQ